MRPVLRAALEAYGGDETRALDTLARAEQEFRDADMMLFAAAAQRRRGELLGGERGAPLVDAADAWMRAQGIEEPSRMADAFAPWFPGGAGAPGSRTRPVKTT